MRGNFGGGSDIRKPGLRRQQEAALFELHGRHLAGVWRETYVVNAVLTIYLNFFVLIVPALKALALFVVLGVFAWKWFRPAAEQTGRGWRAGRGLL